MSYGLILAHATRVRRITIPALRRVLSLTGFCEMCGAATQAVAFHDRGITEVCAACLGEAKPTTPKGTTDVL